LLGQRGYYLPVKYGYSFTNEDVTKTISLVYSKKDYSYLTLPNNIDYKGNTLNFSECENVIYSNQVLRSENERFSLVLQENWNLVCKDRKVTIWQGKQPYKLIVGNDGVMRILNKFDYVIMSTINDPDKENQHQYRNYRLQVLNAGTFRIVNENGKEIWNMWSPAPYHRFEVYYE